MARSLTRALTALGVLGLCLLVAWPLFSQDAPDETPPAAKAPALTGAQYVGSAKCRHCHSDEYDAWQKTPHARAFAVHVPETETIPDETLARHVTGLDAAAHKWVEAGVGCEMCHGPGSLHLKAGHKDKAATIINPKIGGLEADASYSVCVQCHARYTTKAGERWAKGFVPGTNLLPSLKLDAAKQGVTFEQFNEMQGSKHLESSITCVRCHAAHDTEAPAQHFLLRQALPDTCAKCHPDQSDIKKHAPRAKPDATCATCHMPGGQHTFGVPHRPR
jgi:predicted CXXCH cytochrome family protein